MHFSFFRKEKYLHIHIYCAEEKSVKNATKMVKIFKETARDILSSSLYFLNIFFALYNNKINIYSK